jgi:arylformamidase
MQIYDISVPLSEATPTYPGDPGIEITNHSSLKDGDPANVSLLHFGAHSGTHVDAPAHFIENGSKVGSLALTNLIGKVAVVNVPQETRVINQEFITINCEQTCERIIFKTRNSDLWQNLDQGFQSDYTYLAADGAKRLVQLGVKLVGIDYLSIEQYKSQDFETHRILLSNGVVILEGLDMRNVNAGTYELICLPLKIEGGAGDGAPARAILRSLQ